jgi:hypothetical protein
MERVGTSAPCSSMMSLLSTTGYPPWWCDLAKHVRQGCLHPPEAVDRRNVFAERVRYCFAIVDNQTSVWDLVACSPNA